MTAPESDVVKHYCIRPDYIAQTTASTRDSDDAIYWNADRDRYSALFQWQVYLWARDIVKRRRLKTVLDVGCGPGTKLARLIGPIADIYGVDQKSAIDYASRRHPGGHFLVDDLDAPYASLGVTPDLIICSDVIEHVIDPDVLVDYVKRRCGPQTLVLFSTPDRERLRGVDCLRSPHPSHVREWSAREFIEYLGTRGLEVLEQRHLPPVKTALNRVFFTHVLQQWRARRSYRYNFAVLCRPRRRSEGIDGAVLF